MVTTIQVGHRTLTLLKKVKEETHSSSYEEAIQKLVMAQNKEESLAGYLRPYLTKEAAKNILKNIRDKHDRF